MTIYKKVVGFFAMILVFTLGLLLSASTASAAIDGHLTITSPNGGETFTEGDITTITWDASSNIDKVSIGWSTGPGSLNWIAFTAPNTGSYTWNVNVGNTTNTQFLIKITGYETGAGSLTDISDDYFTVYQKNEYPPAPTPTETPTPTQVETVPAPTLNFSADASSIAFNSATNLRWSTTNANSCTASGGWSGAKATSGVQSTGLLTSSKNFTLTCSGPSGSVTKSYYISVANEPATNTPTTNSQPKSTTPVIVQNNVFITSITQIVLANFYYFEGSETTDLKSVDDPSNVEDFTLDKEDDTKLVWLEPIDLSSDDAVEKIENLDDYVTYGDFFVFIEWEFWLFWNVPIEATFYDCGCVATPAIVKDGERIDDSKVVIETRSGEVLGENTENKVTDVSFEIDDGGKYEMVNAVTILGGDKVETKKTDYVLKGTVSDPDATLKVSLNGENLEDEVLVNKENGSFELALALVLGNNAVTVSGTSPKGEILSDSQSIILSEGGLPVYLWIIIVIIVIIGITLLVPKRRTQAI